MLPCSILSEFKRLGKSPHGVGFPRVNCFDDSDPSRFISFGEILYNLAGFVIFRSEEEHSVAVFGKKSRRHERSEALFDRGLAALNSLENFGGAPTPLVRGQEQKNFQMFDRLNMPVDK
jgi:hypothetical protein